MEYRNPKDLKPHPVSVILYGDNHLDDIKESIAKLGILVPITINQNNVIISGHRRWRCAMELKIDNVPVEVRKFASELEEKRSILEFNKQREKTFSQKMKEVKLLKEIEIADANRRKSEGKKLDPTTTLRQGETANIVGREVDIGGATTFRKAEKLWTKAQAGDKQAIKLVNNLDSGKSSINQAYTLLKRNEIKESLKDAEFPKGKYRVIYADPPWLYDNTNPPSFGEQADHYLLKSLTDICNLPVKDITDDNAVLFLWATSPILEDAFKVINAWGFKYKASFIWDKVKHVMGHYNSVRHEFLLIAVKGSCQPDNIKLFDSVQTIERTKEHSEKPEEFRKIIETLYLYGNKVELFGRNIVNGWEVYGNQLS